ncbi:MAG: M56 family metallopeptidase [Terriglobales bacterium]
MMVVFVSSTVAATVLFAVALAVVRWPLRRRSAALRHAVCLSALVGALALPLCVGTLRGSFGLTFSAPRPQGLTSPSHLPVPAPVGRLSAALARLGEEVFTEERRTPVPLAAGYIWLVGVLACLARLGQSHVVLRGILKSAGPVALRGRAGAVPGHIPVRCSTRFGTPAAIGWWNPIILLPTGMLNWPAGQLEDVLAHEVAHISRHDWVAKLLAQVACSLYWFHPLAWSVARRTDLEQEQACDDLVLGRGTDPAAYAETLLRVARMAVTRRELRFATVTAVSESQLRFRVRSILRGAPGAPIRWRTTALLFASTLAVVAAGAATLPAFSARNDAAPAQRDPFFDPADPYQDPQSERLVSAGRMVSAPARMRHDDKSAYEQLLFLSHIPPRSQVDLVAERARWCLSQARQGELVQPLVESLDDDDWRIRGYAAFCLGAVRARSAVPALTANARHPIWRVRAMAAFALAEIADPAVQDAMKTLLADPAWQVRVEATEYFGNLEDGRLASLVRPMVQDPHPAVRYAAEKALRKL